MADFSDKDKVERGNQYFDEGIHEVRVGAVKFDTTPDGKEFCEFTVFGTDGPDDTREANARFWFNTDGGRSYAFGQIRNMVVHNVPEARKEAARKQFNAIKNTTELEEAINKVLVKDNGQIWLQVVQNGTYPKNDGTLGKNFDRDIFGYKPQEKKGTTSNTTGPVSDGAPHPADDPNADAGEQVVAGF